MLMLIDSLVFIYLLVGTRILLFLVPFIYSLYNANKCGYMKVHLEEDAILIPIDKPVPMLSFTLRIMFAILFWPIDCLKVPAVMLKAYLLFNRIALAQLGFYYARTTPFKR